LGLDVCETASSVEPCRDICLLPSGVAVGKMKICFVKVALPVLEVATL
jgi:hypothetical protein